ncbi:MAG: AAA family ATPase [Burkholderiales bacterium]|nr:AAA family ATPase [Burkholderiales bacterium]
MKITIKNLGAIKQAEFTLGELTIICGGNNTGKTYATHATYGFLDFLRTNAEFPVNQSDIEKLYSEGAIQISLQPYIEDLKKHLGISSKNYSKILYKIFGGTEQHFDDASLTFDMDCGDSKLTDKVELTFGTANRGVLNIKSIPDINSLEISLIVEKSDEEPPSKYVVEDMIRSGIGNVLMGNVIPKPFLASAERTGAAIFQKELDFTRNRLIEMLGDKSAKLSPIQLLGKFSGEYPIAVRKNVDFIRELPNITHKESFILKNHPELLEAFKDIIGGEYKVSKDGEIQFYPSSNKRIKLSLVESSSAVRSLLDIGFYLRHVATPGDLLMIDEPELNLHPENQRRVARLFARLVNIGIKVFITTHSDYIIKELNTLIMLNQGGERLKTIAEHENYRDSEMLNPGKVRVYIAEEALIKLDGAQRKTKCQTLVQADIDSKLGIEARSFDKTIEDMNRIQEEIVWGGDE